MSTGPSQALVEGPRVEKLQMCLPTTVANSHEEIQRDPDGISGNALTAFQEVNPTPQGKQENSLGLGPVGIEETAEARLERLGRQKPDAFRSVWSEIGFVFSISMSQVLSVSRA